MSEITRGRQYRGYSEAQTLQKVRRHSPRALEGEHSRSGRVSPVSSAHAPASGVCELRILCRS